LKRIGQPFTIPRAMFQRILPCHPRLPLSG
jgi:hypothetical protein